MEAHDYDGDHQPDLKLLVQRYEEMLREGAISFLEVDSFLMLSDYYEEKNSFDLALDALDHAIEQHPYSATLYIRKGQMLSEQELYSQAFKALEIAMIYEPSDLDIYLTKADIYMRMLEQDKALHALQIAKDYASKDELADLYILESTIYETKKDYHNSIKYLKRALQKEPSNDIALSRLWIVFDLTNEYTDAITYHIDFINENPYSYWAWYNLGLAYLSIGLYEKATEAFDYSIVINEKFEPAYHSYVDSLIILGEYDTALRYLGEYKEFFEADAELWYRLGQCYELKKEYKTARLHYSKALDFNTLGGRVYYNIGTCYADEESWNLAEKSFLEAYAIDRFNEEYCVALADTYDALDHSDKAHEFYHKALALAPKEVNIWIHYIEFLLDEENYSVAIEMLEEAREYVDGLILDYAEAAVLLESGQRQQGFVVLGQALIADYAMHIHLFDISPKLEDDTSIMTFILGYKEIN
jgi:tetratricopeptide (TPR) repeat protein